MHDQEGVIGILDDGVLLSRGRDSSPFSQSTLMMDCKRSEAMTYNREDRGSPYLTPHLHWMTLPATPLSKTDVDADCRILDTQLIHLGPKPFAFNISNIAEYSILSNAFLKSSLTIITGFFDLWHRCMYSKV